MQRSEERPPLSGAVVDKRYGVEGEERMQQYCANLSPVDAEDEDDEDEEDEEGDVIVGV
jgi:hypothetical protein